MYLTNITIRNFRCLDDLPSIPMHRLTVFIGENDAGKSNLLAALDILLTNRTPAPNDYRTLSDEKCADSITIAGTFDLEDFDSLPPDYCVPGTRQIRLTKVFGPSGLKTTVDGSGYVDPRWNSFAKQQAPAQKELLQTLGLVPGVNTDQRLIQFAEAVEQGVIPKQPTALEVKPQDLAPYLPRFEMVASSDYQRPDSMVQRTFQSVVDNALHPPSVDGGERVLRPDLQQVKTDITQVLNDEVARMQETLQRANPRLKAISVSPQIDFSKSVSAVNLLVDLGAGMHPADLCGEGTKKKLWMGLLDWLGQKQQETRDICTIRAYDEPDVNLDYGAERKLFASIMDEVRQTDTRTQAIVCTHAITLVDRAPGRSINLICVHDDNSREISYIDCDSDEEVKDFLSTVGRTIGLSNSALFYERAFLVVEGESEDQALPILYRNLYGHSMIEDGIVHIPLYTCSAWKATLRLLKRNRSHLTLLLLDQDCQSMGSSGRVTSQALMELDYPAEYLANNCYYIGTKEFEDAFATDDLTAVLNAHWPKEDGSAWLPGEVDDFRDPKYKFSEDLLHHVCRTCIKPRRCETKKPEFAEKLASHCKSEAQVPHEIRNVFTHLRTIAGCGQSHAK